MPDRQKLIVVGAGGLGSEIVWTIENLNARDRPLELIGFCDDAENKKGQLFCGYPILGTPEEVDHGRAEKPQFICAIGDNKRRKAMVRRLTALDWQAASVVDPSLIGAASARIGAGTYIAPGCVLSANTVLGDHVILNLGCTIGHNGIVEDFGQISPGGRVSGFTTVKVGAFLGSNAVAAPGVTIGEWATLGACSFAVTDVPDGTTAVGTPAHVVFRARGAN